MRRSRTFTRLVVVECTYRSSVETAVRAAHRQLGLSRGREVEGFHGLPAAQNDPAPIDRRTHGLDQRRDELLKVIRIVGAIEGVHVATHVETLELGQSRWLDDVVPKGGR